jgi:hypothetical protein
MDLNSRRGRQNLFRLGIFVLLPVMLIIGFAMEAMNINKYITLVVIVTGLSMFSVQVFMSKIKY